MIPFGIIFPDQVESSAYWVLDRCTSEQHGLGGFITRYLTGLWSFALQNREFPLPQIRKGILEASLPSQKIERYTNGFSRRSIFYLVLHCDFNDP